MPTISKISMTGYSPIANKKLSQKASNPISTNNQNSTSLMSPNAHYAKQQVSFKAKLPLDQATKFVNGFHLEQHLAHVEDSVDTLLHAALHPDLKDQAIGHISEFLNHQDEYIRFHAISHAECAIKKNPSLALAVPELIHPLTKFLTDTGSLSASTCDAASNTIKMLIKKNPSFATHELLYNHLIPRLNGGLYDRNVLSLSKHVIKINNSLATHELVHNHIKPIIKTNMKKTMTCKKELKIVKACAKIKPSIATDDLIDMVEDLRQEALNYSLPSAFEKKLTACRERTYNALIAAKSKQPEGR